MSVSDSGNTDGKTVQLKRDFGLITACSLITGGVVGSGIFVSPQGVLLGSGSFGLSLIIWTLCGLLSLCGALTYAEMGNIIPKSGSAYYYLKEIYGDCAGFVYMFTFIFFAVPAGRAIVALTCAEYLTAIFFNDGCGSSPSYITKTLATTILILVGAINCKSVSLTGNVNTIFTGAKIIGLGVIIVGGSVYIINGHSNNLSLENSFKESSTNLASLSEAVLSGMWAYAGWNGLNCLTEELKKPEKNLSLSILISIPTITAVYILANISYFTVLSQDDIVTSASVAKSWAYIVMPKIGWFVPVTVIISTFGTSVCNLLANSRLAFVAAREGHLPMLASMVHIKYFTPAPAVFLLSLLSVMYIYFGTIIQLIQYTGVVEWFSHGMVGVGLLILRIKKRNTHRPYKAPLICPILLVLFCIPLSLSPIIGNPQWGYFFALFILLFGAILWLLVVKMKLSHHFSGIAKMTELFQLLAQVSPSEYTEG